MKSVAMSLLLAYPLFAGTVAVGNGTADIPEGTVISISAAPAPPDMVFDRWLGDTSGLADEFAGQTTLTMPAGDVSLTATYKPDPDLPPPPPPPPPPPGSTVEVNATMETDPVGDPDDMWLWQHPTDLSKSILYAADKEDNRIPWFDLDGNKLGEFDEPERPNNIDGRGNLFGASTRRHDEIGLYTVDPVTNAVTKRGAIDTGVADTYGFCLYVSPISGKTYAFVSGKGGDIEQYEIDTTNYTGTLVRSIPTAKCEGMAAHDASARLFFAEERGSFCVIGAEPTAGTSCTEISSVSSDELTGDLEGVTVVGDLYVIVSVQRKGRFAVYDMAGPDYHFRGLFKIVEGNGIDRVSGTDGISFHAGNYGGPYTAGVFFCHDAANGSGGRNMKAVPWDDIAAALGLQNP